MPSAPIDILRTYWGFEQFRPPQEEIIRSVLEGHDTLALLPTGGGKSVCFQVPALAREGICIVISPLIALMKDQVRQLQKRNIPAIAIYSGMPYRDVDRLLDNCIYGQTKFLYLSPERLRSELAEERIRRMNVNLIAVDEAHCISQWGYDFRPPYLEIAKVREWFPETPVLALTATATTEVINDIQEKLEFRRRKVIQKSFERPNLIYAVLREEGKLEKMLQIINRVKGSGIVYVRSRRKTKEIASFLQSRGIGADFYHAGLDQKERSRRQDAWIENRTRIMVCTNAFGMGIDKPDVRLVIHLEPPDSLEAYFQEAGRAGRDQQRSYAVLLYDNNDRLNLERQFELAFPPMEEIRRVYRALGSYYQLAIGSGQGLSFDFDLVSFAQTYQLEPAKTLQALKLLEQGGWIVLTEAVFHPATLMIKVSKDELYDYQLRNPRLDRVLKAVLRTYQGAFSQPLQLREHQLARFLEIPHTELVQAFRLLHKDQIIDYQPLRDRPQLIFFHERIDADNLNIDQQLYSFRRNRYLERIRAAIRYAETTTICRSQQLLAYFGEINAPPCGLCDVCTGRHRKELSEEEYHKLRDKIKFLLQRNSLKLEQVVDSFSPKWRERVLKALDFLLDEGWIDKQGDRLSWKGDR